jgi:hypothetical protein
VLLHRLDDTGYATQDWFRVRFVWTNFHHVALGASSFQRLLFPGLAAAAPPAYKNGQLRL